MAISLNATPSFAIGNESSQLSPTFNRISTLKGRMLIGKYEIGKKIGEGTFAKVRIGRDISTNKKIAIKIFDYRKVKNKAERGLVEREKCILSLLNHPNIVRLHNLVDDIEGGKCYMILEYVSGGELFEHIVSHGRLREKDARRFMRQIISALDYCHAHLIVHRDLKPENVLLDDELNIKITDFGLANFMSPGQNFKTFCGSLHYACPEVLRGQEYLGPGADIWALGIILYCLVTGTQPWDGSTSEQILHQIVVDGLHVPAWLTQECADLIIKLLRFKEQDRLSIGEIKNHPWVLKGYDSSPSSLLPRYERLSILDEQIIFQLFQLGFSITSKERESIIRGYGSDVVTTYHALLDNRMSTFESDQEEIVNPVIDSGFPQLLHHPFSKHEGQKKQYSSAGKHLGVPTKTSHSVQALEEHKSATTRTTLLSPLPKTPTNFARRFFSHSKDSSSSIDDGLPHSPNCQTPAPFTGSHLVSPLHSMLSPRLNESKSPLPTKTNQFKSSESPSQSASPKHSSPSSGPLSRFRIPRFWHRSHNANYVACLCKSDQDEKSPSSSVRSPVSCKPSSPKPVHSFSRKSPNYDLCTSISVATTNHFTQRDTLDFSKLSAPSTLSKPHQLNGSARNSRHNSNVQLRKPSLHDIFVLPNQNQFIPSTDTNVALALNEYLESTLPNPISGAPSTTGCH